MGTSSARPVGDQLGPLGIEHVPADIVRFILRGADDVSRFHFGKGLGDDGVRLQGVCTGDEVPFAGPSLSALSGVVDIVLGDSVCVSGRSSVYPNNSAPIVPAVDRRIQETFARYATVEATWSLHMPSLRLLRGAIDRIATQGVVALVLDAGWLEGRSGRGVRLSLQDELSDIYVFNLGGQQPAQRAHEGRGGNGVARTDAPGPVAAAVFIGVKREVPDDVAIHYRGVDNHLKWQQKLDVISRAGLRDDAWQIIEPDEDGDWA